MSTPQLEDGYIRIANVLYEAIMLGGFSQRELLVLMAIMRKTYGFRKTVDDMSASQIGLLCGVARQHVTTTLNALVARNVITKKRGEFGMLIGIQKDNRKWISTSRLNFQLTDMAQVQDDSPESGLVPDRDTSQIGTGDSPESGQGDSPKSGHTKDNVPKDNQQKTNSCAPRADRDSVGETPAGQTGRAKTGLTTELHDRFERFYAAYPLKKSRGRAEKEFGKLRPDEEQLAAMLIAIEKRKASGTWIDPKYIPYPASWLNAKGWLDVLQTEYTPVEREVIETFNDLLGGQLGEVSPDLFVSERAALIDEFLTFSNRPELAKRYFSYLRDRTELPPRIGFDRLIGRQGYGDASGGKFERNAA